MKIALGYVLTYGWVFAVLGLSLAARRRLSAGEETSRKIVHVLVSFAFIPMYACFGTGFHLAVPPFTFIILNYISLKKNLFTMMERSEKSSYGTVWYALSMTLMAGACVADASLVPAYAAGLFCMSLGDGLAPLFGAIRRGNRPLFGGKRSLYGCLSVFAICTLVCAVVSAAFNVGMSPAAVALLGLFGAVMECAGLGGIDNLTLPLGVFALSAALGMRV